MQDYRKLMVWQKAHELVLALYAASRAFPDDERYGLTSQIRRAAASIPMNIAEGSGRDTGPDFRRFVYVAMGSANEVEYQLLLARDLSYVQRPVYDRLHGDLNEVKRMLTGLIQSIEGKS